MLMKNKKIFFFLLAIAISVYSKTTFAQADSKLSWVANVGARQFPSSAKIFIVKAKSDTSKNIAKQIQEAIDQLCKKRWRYRYV